jgi:glycosyltransferase involved in cell wall biosynthesis
MQPKVIVVMPAYNAARTLRMTYEGLPKECIDSIILVDDGSTDDTIAIARRLNLEVFVHTRNFGYGANQKTCYREALKAGADIVAMVHPDYQYDPTLLPEIIQPIIDGKADIVLGSRLNTGLQKGSALEQGMPWWKYFSNRFLTELENLCFGLHHSEYHTGYRAFHRSALEAVNFEMNSDSFVFDQEILAQAVANQLRIGEIAVPVRYFKEASSANFLQSAAYGLRILWLLAKFLAHKSGVHCSRQFESLDRRYHPATDQEAEPHRSGL